MLGPLGGSISFVNCQDGLAEGPSLHTGHEPPQLETNAAAEPCPSPRGAGRPPPSRVRGNEGHCIRHARRVQAVLLSSHQPAGVS